jgi:hypothetical protein
MKSFAATFSALAIVLFLVGVVGCSDRVSTHGKTIRNFRFIGTNTTLGAVTQRLGPYDRVSGSGIQMFEYDLADGSTIVLWPDWPFQSTNLIHRVAQVRGATHTDGRTYTDLVRRAGW